MRTPISPWPIRVRYEMLYMLYKAYYRKKNIVVLVWPGAWSKSAHKCIPYSNRCMQNFIQIG